MLPNIVGKRLVGPPMVAVWAVAVVFGMYGLVRYQMTPAAVASIAPAQWPAGVSFSHSSERSTLIMTLHPQCPCSRASLHELAEMIGSLEGPSRRTHFVRSAGECAGGLAGRRSLATGQNDPRGDGFGGQGRPATRRRLGRLLRARSWCTTRPGLSGSAAVSPMVEGTKATTPGSFQYWPWCEPGNRRLRRHPFMVVRWGFARSGGTD